MRTSRQFQRLLSEDVQVKTAWINTAEHCMQFAHLKSMIRLSYVFELLGTFVQCWHAHAMYSILLQAGDTSPLLDEVWRVLVIIINIMLVIINYYF